MSTQVPDPVWSVLINYSFLRGTHRYHSDSDSEQMIVSVAVGMAFMLFFVSISLGPVNTDWTSMTSLGLLIVGGVAGYFYESNNIIIERNRLTNYLHEHYYEIWLSLSKAQTKDQAKIAVDRGLFKIEKVLDRLI